MFALVITVGQAITCKLMELYKTTNQRRVPWKRQIIMHVQQYTASHKTFNPLAQ